MITFEKACNLIEEINVPLITERVDLMGSLNRVLAEDAFSDIPVPPFDKSAMDGFACRRADLDNDLEIIEEIPAGKVPQKAIGLNQCSRIMTGGMVPSGADMVVQLEHTSETVQGHIRCIKKSSSTNICIAGEDIQEGEMVLRKGEILRAQHIAILATAGITNPLVYGPMPLAVISTGNELVEPDVIPEKSQIRNSNGWQILAQATQQGYHPTFLGIVKDNQDELKAIISEAIEKYRIVIISGGVSVGDYDYVPGVLKQLGAECLFHGLDTKPGRHLLFSRKDNTLIFGLPGNPVSSFIQFELLIKPLLDKLKGVNQKQEVRKIPLDTDYQRKSADQLLFIPGKITDEETVIPLEYHGSAHIHAYSRANCIIELPKSLTLIKKGEMINVRSL